MANIFTQEQLDQAKSLLEGGKPFFQMTDDMGIERSEVMILRREVMDAFGRETIMPLLRAARNAAGGNTFSYFPERIRQMSLTDVAVIDEMVTNLQAAIDELNTIKADLF